MKMKILMTAVLASVVMTAAAVQAQEQGQDRPERPAFSTLDTNGDGGLTLEEMQAHGEARFAQADANGDGGLSREELIVAADARAADRVTQMFARHDANEDGVLQQSEMPKNGGDRAERMFDRADADEDGTITEAEFEAAKDRMGGRKGQRDRG
jgi:Ca2+-binding EF-hand superfamily protein